jgi:hypothetical protein
MKKIIFLLMLLTSIAWAKDSISKSEAIIRKSFEDLFNFCKGKKSVNFCSNEHMQLAVTILKKKQEETKLKMERLEEERKNAEKIRKKNLVKGEIWIWILRRHFLDRHI